jgi:glyoxylase-like metal-dependent hydrolase (beta-lactamase superfamily II)
MRAEASFSRREALKFSLAAGVAFLVPSTLLGRPSTKRHEIPVPWPGYDSVRLGDLGITTLYDSGVKLDVGPEYFAVGQPPEAVEALLSARFLPTTATIENVIPALVDSGEELVLFDTGIGSKGESQQDGQLRERMVRSGYDPADVTAVALTHLHPENIGGLLIEGAPAFPGASQYFVGEKEFKYWTEEASRAGQSQDAVDLVANTLEPIMNKIRFISGSSEILSGIRPVEAFGHTPGHLAFEVSSGDKSLLIAGDAATHYVVSFEQPKWYSPTDMDQKGAAQTRLHILADVAQRRIPMIGYHLPFPPLGFVDKTDTGFKWVAETYQLSL